MDSKFADKKLADVSEDDLVKLGFLGKDVPPETQYLVNTARANPNTVSSITCFAAYCFTRVYQRALTAQDPAMLPASPTSPTSLASRTSPSPTLSDAETLWSEMNSEAFTVVAPNMVSKYEVRFYYHGIGDIQLLWCSDLETNPFPVPLVGTRFHNIPAKIAVFNTLLNGVWDQVAPEIISAIKAHGLHYFALTTARFLHRREQRAIKPRPCRSLDCCLHRHQG